MEETRPTWDQKIDEATARWLLSHDVVKITHHWQFTGEDTSEDWIELHTKDKGSRKFPTSFFSDGKHFRFDPDHRRLIRPSYLGEQAAKTIEAIDKWEKKNKDDRAEFERLKRKFES